MAEAYLHRSNALDIARRRWPGQSAIPEYIARVDAVPATTTGSGWADKLVGSGVADFLINAGAPTAGAQILAGSTQVSLGGNKQLTIPYAETDGNGAAFVLENGALPVVNYSFSAGATLTAKKLGAIIPISREVFEYTQAEPLVRQMQAGAFALQLDTVLLGNANTDDVKPAGIFYNANAALTQPLLRLAKRVQWSQMCRRWSAPSLRLLMAGRSI
jgi:capsid protein